MKMSKDELMKKIDESEISDEVKISLMEDITDSIEVPEVDNSALDELQAKYDELLAKYTELLEKYKARFLDGESKEDEPKEDEVEELKEEEVIDVKEI